MKNWSDSIPGPTDVELGLARPSSILYHATAPDRPARGLVFILHGFGQDTNSEYDLKLREHVAGTSQMLALTVEYHCYRSRPSLGARIDLGPEAAFRLQALARQSGLPEPAPGSPLGPWIETLGRGLTQRAEVRAVLVPPNGDYQNFGVMQALDPLYVLAHLRKEQVSFDPRRLWLFGSSHGGYLAHLIHKFAPNTFSALIDNSGYTRANRTYLGQGVEFSFSLGQLILACSVLCRWTFSDVYSPSYFGIAQDLIRQTAFRPHLAEMARVSDKGCRIRMINSAEDSISPIGPKTRQDESYRALGFDSQLTPHGGEAGTPEYVKSQAHGDVSLKKLFDHFAPGLMDHPNPGPLDGERGTELSFDCLEATYRVKHTPEPPGVSVQVLRP
jgi:hypothetical protein